MFDNILEVANKYRSGPGKVDLHGAFLSGPLKRLSYCTPRSTFLCCSVSIHLKRSMGDSQPLHIFQLGTFRTRGQDRRLCVRFAC